MNFAKGRKRKGEREGIHIGNVINMDEMPEKSKRNETYQQNYARMDTRTFSLGRKISMLFQAIPCSGRVSNDLQHLRKIYLLTAPTA